VPNADATPADSPRSCSSSAPCSPRIAALFPQQPHVGLKSMLASPRHAIHPRPASSLSSPRQLTTLAAAIAARPGSPRVLSYEDETPLAPGVPDSAHMPHATDEVSITLAQLLHGAKDLFTLSEMVAKKQSSLKPAEVRWRAALRVCSAGGLPGTAGRHPLQARLHPRLAPCRPQRLHHPMPNWGPAAAGVRRADSRRQPGRRRPAPAVG
jgi:hypothetical protein